MSQEDVLKIIKELGGEATISDIRQRARKKYPDRTLYLYVNNRLNKLQKWGFIRKVNTGEKMVWRIIK